MAYTGTRRCRTSTSTSSAGGRSGGCWRGPASGLPSRRGRGQLPPATELGRHIMASRLRFGIFMAPFHAPGTNPTLALERNLQLVQYLDALGYDEAWFGEHHSAGSEII